MSDEDREKTAFVVPDGSLNEYNVLSFGLCNAPSTFQRLIDKVLGSLKWKIALVYIDDTVVFSKCFDQHLIDLRLVLEAFRRSRLTLKPLKCIFANHELKFLGHVVTKEGVTVNSKKVEAINKVPSPNTLKKVQSFVSLCSYYRKFIENFSIIARPLSRLSQANVPFVWDEECEKTFQLLKKKLTEAPVLAHPDENLETTLDIVKGR
jgi:hypothetical protein